MKQIDFTIVTPSYNYAKYIREMLDSVVSQEGVSYEHLIFDAGSSDGTIEIIREYEHVSLTVEADKGMSDAINKGFKKSRGKWVMWLNTDDRLKPQALARVKAFAESCPNADVIYGCWDFINEDGTFQRRMGVFPFRKLLLIHKGCYIASTSTFFRKETVMDQGYYLCEKFSYVMDGEYYARLAMEGKKFVYMKKVLADFRVHDASLSLKHTNPNSIEEVLDLELQRAEGTSIRRQYGIRLFHGIRSAHLNSVVDSILFYSLGGVKKILRFIYQPK